MIVNLWRVRNTALHTPQSHRFFFKLLMLTFKVLVVRHRVYVLPKQELLRRIHYMRWKR